MKLGSLKFSDYMYVLVYENGIFLNVLIGLYTT